MRLKAKRRPYSDVQSYGGVAIPTELTQAWTEEQWFSFEKAPRCHRKAGVEALDGEVAVTMAHHLSILWRAQRAQSLTQVA